MKRVAAVLFAAVLLGFPAALAQEKANAWQGIDGWIALLRGRGVQFLDRWPELGSETESRFLLILFGRPPEHEKFAWFVQNHAIRGCPMLIASDRPEMNQVLTLFDTQLEFDAGYRVEEPSRMFHEYADCPLVSPSGDASDLFAGVAKLALNRPAYFSQSRQLATAAFLPKARGGGRRRPCILVRNSPKQVFVSDHSLFINLMLTEESNFTFAGNLIDWLGAREVLFFCDGQVIHPAMFPDGYPDLGSQLSIRLLDRALRGMEESGTMRNFEPRTIAFGVASLSVLLAATLALWIYRRPLGAPEALVRAPALIRDFGLAGEARTEDRNLRIPAQEFLQSWWKRYRARKQFGPEQAPAPGNLQVRGGSMWARRGLKQDLKALSEAMARDQGRITLAEFRRLIECARRCDEAPAEMEVG